VEVNFGKQIACLSCLLVFIIFSLTLEVIFKSIYVFVRLCVISFVASCFHINYTKFGSYTFCKFTFLLSYCDLLLRTG
jgi:hypothetical protein